MVTEGDAETSQAVSKRLHVSGLNVEQCQEKDVRARFASFGLAVEGKVFNWPPGIDAVGNKTNWCFVDVRGTEGQIQRAMTLLNGTLWKGSKLRIGFAKQQTWKDRIQGANDGDAKQKKRKRKTGKDVEGFEAEQIDQPIRPDQIDASGVGQGVLWGWKKTPAGHLLRPMHMRPAHPIAHPAPLLQKKEDDKKIRAKKDRVKVKTLTRAKCITIDPLRYNPVHLSGAMLQGSDEKAAPAGHEWSCSQNEDGTSAHWTLRDAQGHVVQEEIVSVRPAHPEGQDWDAVFKGSDEERSEGEYEDVDYQFDDEIDAAIDLAGGEEDEESDLHADMMGVGGVSHTEAPAVDDAEEESDEAQGIEYPHYDPDDEDTFSEGYQEVAVTDERGPSAQAWDGEKMDQLDLLKKMFGPRGIRGEKSASSLPDTSFEDVDGVHEIYPIHVEEGSVTDSTAEVEPSLHAAPTSTSGAARRAALLSTIQPKAALQTQFQPIVRFDPAAAGLEDGGGEEEEEEEGGGNGEGDDDQMEDESAESRLQQEQSQQPLIHKVPSAEQPRDADRVEMQKLTDMFRPKEDKGGFSLLADLDLDLDDELNFEPDIDEDDNDDYDDDVAAYDEPATTFADTSATTNAAAAAAVATAPLFFPQIDAHGQVSKAGKDIFSSLLRELDTNEAMARFYVPDDEETLQRKWEERKSTLTQEYKRRHREALKKKKRKFTGSRAAGTAPLPGRRRKIAG